MRGASMNMWGVVCACAALAAGGAFATITPGSNTPVQGRTLGTTEEKASVEPTIFTTELATISHIARIGIDISITLNKQEYDEDCYLQTPQGQTYNLTGEPINGVQFYPTSTNFVSCRVVIGPMEENLLGTWTLCGKRTEGQNTYERCQPGRIVWGTNNPEASWGTSTQARINHVVSYDFTLDPAVRGTGNINTCRVITPAGEDIALTATSNYPGLQLNTRNANTCNVIFGPIDANFIGGWVLYGIWTTNAGVLNELILPMNFFLYDEEDPYSQAYNVTDMNMETHVLSVAGTLVVSVTGSGSRVDCEFVTNTGETYDENSSSSLQTATFVNNNNAACRLQLGPMTQDMFGDWQLIGKFRSSNRFNEIRLPFRLIEEDPANPLPDDTDRSIIYLARQQFASTYGVSHLVTTATGSRIVTQSCHIRTPDNLQYVLREGLVIPGVEGVFGSGISCGVRVHVNDESSMGEWMLIARIADRDVPLEWRVPFNIIAEDPANPLPDDTDRRITYLPPQQFVSSYGESHLVTTSMNSRIERESCHIKTPDNLQYVLREGLVIPGVEGVVSYGMSCGVRVHVNDKSAAGEWMLIARVSDRGVPSEWRAVFDISVEGESDEILENISEENSVEDGGIENPAPTMLSSISYGAKLGVNITITLSKKEYTEECYLLTPQGKVLTLDNAHFDGVQVFPTSTNFVSCRVVIGPMDETLLGTWTLCGKHIDGSVQERCQPGNISWASNNPADNWATTTHGHFDHVVHYGFTLAPFVRGTGTLNTCHAITPAGEDIIVTRDSDYPGLAFVSGSSQDTTTCSIRFGAIDANFLGNWVLYGTYNSHNVGFNVVSQPMTFFLYDEENPYNQAYNVTDMDMESHVLTEGMTVTVTATGSGTRQGCELISNTGQVYDEITIASVEGVSFNNNNNAACRLLVGPLTENMFGEWRLIGKFLRNNVLFIEIRQPFRLLKEDPANPIPDDIERSIEYVNAANEYTSFGNSHTFSTATNSRTSTDSCHLQTPDHLQYILRNNTIEPGFQTVTASNMSCGVRLHINSDDAIGEWMLIARITEQSRHIERRLPITIHVEEEVNAVTNIITVAEGNDLYMRLEKSTTLFDTCVLIGPARNDAERDENFLDTCGFIVRDVTLADAGIWEIEYGTGKKYRALIHVNVTARFETPENSSLVWAKDTPLDKTIGPEDTVFCRVEDPTGLTVFEGFARCHITLDRVRSEHAGVWMMTIGTAGRVRAETYEFVVSLSHADSKAEVVTSVVSEKPSVMLSCQVASEHNVTACKFRDPSGKMLLASQGVGEDRYSFHDSGVSLRSEVSGHECGLRITNPVVEDLGLWRCVVETEAETYYGFLTVLCPWAMQDPAVAVAVVSVPTLTSEAESIKTVEGNMITMRCSVQSSIRYCYFRAQNGTVFSVSPGGSEWFEYAGAGLDAGECSIRFPALQATDSGRWSCHVGFNDHSEPEQLAQINVHVDDLMVADQYHLSDASNTLVVHGQVHSQHSLEYCRFVRMDGRGFTSTDVPSGYEDHSLLANGKCEIRIPNPNIVEQHPWAVAAKILGYSAELTRNTQHTLTIPEAETEHPDTELEQPVTEQEHHDHRGSKLTVILLCVLVISLSLFIIGLLLGPKKNRDWIQRRTTNLRNSIRRSLIKKPLTVEENAQPEQITPTAA